MRNINGRISRLERAHHRVKRYLVLYQDMRDKQYYKDSIGRRYHESELDSLNDLYQLLMVKYVWPDE